MKKLLQFLARHRPHREISGDDGEKYLNRYFLFAIGPKNDPWIVAYLHHFVASDPDRGYHDHPWPWAVSWVLAGWYYEYFVQDEQLRQRRIAITTRDPGDWIKIDKFHKHRVVLAQGHECWTLFIHGPWIKPWGFWRPTEKPKYPGYLGQLAYTEYSNKPSIGWWRK